MNIKNILFGKLFSKTLITAIFFTLIPNLAFANINFKTDNISTAINEQSHNHEADYKNSEVFTSKAIESKDKFTSIGFSFKPKSPQNTLVEIDVRFMSTKGTWSEWVEVDSENDPIKPNTKYFTASSDYSSAFQYKTRLYGSEHNMPSISDVSWTFLNVPEIEVQAAPKAQFEATKGSITSSNIKSSNTNVISRKEWGANESYRYGNEDKDAVLVNISDDTYKKFASELHRSKVIKTNKNGDKYKWPLEYPTKVNKFIIHHTATTKNLDNPKQAIRDIYYYHSIVKGWGDIGYNYIVDQNGVIYEGRAGGDRVIGAHAGLYNTGSVGIAVLGNYNNENPNVKVINSLGKFIGEKSRIHGINPIKHSTFRGLNLPNIIAHRDVMSTACPGSNLYDKLDAIRSIAKMYFDGNKKLYSTDYNFEILNKQTYTEINSEESKTITIKVQNTGNKEWNNRTYISLVNAVDIKNNITLSTSKNISSKIKMNEKSVPKGGYATFDVKINSKGSGVAVMDLIPVINSNKKLSKHIYVPVNILEPVYSYSIVGKQMPSNTMKKNEKFTGYIKLKNTGNTTWNKTGINNIKIYTFNNFGRKTKFKNPSSNILASLYEKEVAPGKTGIFKFTLKAPSKNGYYEEYFKPYIDGKVLIDGSPISFKTSVGTSKPSASISRIKYSKELKQGKKYLIQVFVKNNGTETLTKNNTNLDITTDKSIPVSSYYPVKHDIKPGSSYIMNAVLTVSNSATVGNHNISAKIKYKNAVISGKNKDVNISVIKDETRISVKATNIVAIPKIAKNNVKHTITSSNFVNHDSKNIRVKLGFTGIPKISSSNNFAMYSGSSFVARFNANDIVSVTENNGTYTIKNSTKIYKKHGPMRFKALGNGVMKIVNFDHKPAWNPNLNDNEYKGILEVRKDDGNLIVINDLDLSDYLKGLGEVSNYENPEKIKAIIVAARSYAKYYMNDDNKKFPGKPYNLNDDPNTSQRYLGYGLEKRSPHIATAVDETNGEVVTYNGKIVKAPYFSQSDGTVTKSAKDVWGWDNTPYLTPVDDSMCSSTEFAGHGVGMSGCGAKALALKGKNYKEILEYYYTGAKVKII